MPLNIPSVLREKTFLFHTNIHFSFNIIHTTYGPYSVHKGCILVATRNESFETNLISLTKRASIFSMCLQTLPTFLVGQPT